MDTDACNTQLQKGRLTVDQIIAEYPDLTPRDIEAALKHEEASAAA
jgi:uncharacterized protein (DUF433 family)